MDSFKPNITRLSTSNPALFAVWRKKLVKWVTSVGLEKHLEKNVTELITEVTANPTDMTGITTRSRAKANSTAVSEAATTTKDKVEVEHDIVAASSKVYMMVMELLDDPLQAQMARFDFASEIVKDLDERFEAARITHAEKIKFEFNTLVLEKAEKHATFLDEFLRLVQELDFVGAGMTSPEQATKLLAKLNIAWLTGSIRRDYRVKKKGKDDIDMGMEFVLPRVRQYFKDELASRQEHEMAQAMKKISIGKIKPRSRMPWS